MNKKTVMHSFTVNVPESNMKDIKVCLGVKVSRNTGIYLGIPSFWGKTKCEAMSYVRDKVLMKLKSWKQQTISKRKKVLIKAMACSIPTYTTTCFKLPKKICGEIQLQDLMIGF